MIKFITEPKNLVTSLVIPTTKKLTEAQRAAKNLASKRYRTNLTPEQRAANKRYRANLTPEQQKRYSLQKQQYYKTPAGAVALQQTKARYFAKMTSEQYAAKNYTNVRYRARLKEQSPYAGMSKSMIIHEKARAKRWALQQDEREQKARDDKNKVWYEENRL